jgi:hypothetical protein
VALILLFALGLPGFAAAGQIHYAAERGDVARVRSLLQANPRLISSTDENWETPCPFGKPA